MGDIKDHSTTELREELARRPVAVEEAEAKFEAAKGTEDFSAPAREVEAIAAKLEHEDPAISTEEATARAKAAVEHPDPFNTVNGYGDEPVDERGQYESEVEDGVAAPADREDADDEDRVADNAEVADADAEAIEFSDGVRAENEDAAVEDDEKEA